jgi:hypothetical protein
MTNEELIKRATLMENEEIFYFNSNEYPKNTHCPSFLNEMICEIRRSGKILNSPYE